MSTKIDVLILGETPAGALAAAALKEIRPNAKVMLVKTGTESFGPGEHLSPQACTALTETQAWDQVELEAGPISVGTTWRWGKTPDLWDADLLPVADLKELKRPGGFFEERRQTGFMISPQTLASILSRLAKQKGCEVVDGFEKVVVLDDKVHSAVVGDGVEIEPKIVIDAIGRSSGFRDGSTNPSVFDFSAAWAFCPDAELPVDICDHGTRTQILSVPWGCTWYSPVKGGAVVGAAWPKALFEGADPAERLTAAIKAEPTTADRLSGAGEIGEVHSADSTTMIADKMTGVNWMLAGESCGLISPIINTSLTASILSGREAAYAAAEAIEDPEGGSGYLQAYADLQKHRISQAAQLSDWMICANDLMSEASEKRRDASLALGYKMEAGSFAGSNHGPGYSDNGLGLTGAGDYTLLSLKAMANQILDDPAALKIAENNVFKLDVGKAERILLPMCSDGKVTLIQAVTRGGKVLPMTPVITILGQILRAESKVNRIMEKIQESAQRSGLQPEMALFLLLETFEAMVIDGWIDASCIEKRPLFDFSFIRNRVVHLNEDTDDLGWQ